MFRTRIVPVSVGRAWWCGEHDGQHSPWRTNQYHAAAWIWYKWVSPSWWSFCRISVPTWCLLSSADSLQSIKGREGEGRLLSVWVNALRAARSLVNVFIAWLVRCLFFSECHESLTKPHMRIITLVFVSSAVVADCASRAFTLSRKKNHVLLSPSSRCHRSCRDCEALSCVTCES
eukprot:SAG31_NODE_1832_length_7148_cov_5.322315_5_plen_175_part_00